MAVAQRLLAEGEHVMEPWIGDVRHALRTFRKAPGWTLGVAGTLALGIGAATAMFSIGNAVLFRPLPFPQPDRVVALWGANPQKGAEQRRVTLADFADWRARSHSFEALGYSFLWPGSRTTIVETPAALAVNIAQVSSGWLRALGMQPVRGRIFTPDEDRVSAHLVAMISDGFWARQYGRDPAVVGRTLTVDSFTLKSYQIVGVMPGGLTFPPETDVWLSLGAAQFEPPSPGAGKRCCEWLQVIGRLRSGVPVGSASLELNDLQKAILAEHGPADVNPDVAVTPLARYLTAGVRRAILMLMAAVGCVLLIACVNAANLLLARSGLRRHEMAIRSALGATRQRIVRQLLTESVMIALAAGAAGVWLGSTALNVVRAMAPDVPRLSEARPDAAFFAICAVTAMATGLIFGMAPAFAWSGAGFVHARPAVGQGRRLREALVVAEVALSAVLLVGAALLLRSLERLNSVDPGFRPEGVLTARIDMTSSAYSTSAEPGPNRPQVSFRELMEQVRRLPGVTAVGGANRLPLSGLVESHGNPLAAEGSSDPSPRGDERAVTPDYFRVMGTRLLRGREFTEADTDQSAPVAIVSEAAARRWWPGLDPIGRRMGTINTRFPSPTPHWLTVVGVVADVRYQGLESAPEPQFYLPYFRGEWRSPYLVVRTAGDPAALGLSLRRVVAAADGNAVTTDVRPMEALVAASTSEARLRARLLAAFSLLALFLAAVGIYGVMSCVVEQRTAEVGVRMALGARPADIFAMMLGRGLALAGVGLAAGNAAGWVLRRVLDGLLFETPVLEPVALAGAAAILLVCAGVACWIPSRRAARVDPVEALRA